MDSLVVVIMMLAFALVLFLIEIYFLPGVTVAGVFASILLAAAVVSAFSIRLREGVMAMAVAIFMALIMMFLSFRKHHVAHLKKD